MTRFRKGDYVKNTGYAEDIYKGTDAYPKSLKEMDTADSITHTGTVLQITRAYPKSFWGKEITNTQGTRNLLYIGMPYSAFKKISQSEAMALLL
jgi:riboflavin synthase alpha subunit